MIADAMDYDRADIIWEIRETVLDRQNNAVVQGVALGRTVEADGQHGAGLLDGEQRGSGPRRGGGGVSHGGCWFLDRIVMFYNEFGRSQPLRRPGERRDP